MSEFDKQLRGNETELTGNWLVQNGQVTGDSTSQRIEWLTAHYLTKVADGPEGGGWEALYQDPVDGRYWERSYPQGELHGGGPPRLRILTSDEGEKKYRLGAVSDSLNAVVEGISRLPSDFYAGSKSMLQLVTESGVAGFPLALAVESISTYITAHPQIVDAWLRWSENKRVSSGWHFNRRAGGFEIGYHPGGESLNIGDPHFACAEFVVREVRSIMAIPR